MSVIGTKWTCYSRAKRLIFVAMMKSFSWSPLIFFVRSDTVA